MIYSGNGFAEFPEINSNPDTMQTENVHKSAYEDMIAKATGAPPELLPILENIMRDEVFHSTLDWQSFAQFREGARKAHRIYLEHAEFYDAASRHRRASFRLLTAEDALDSARKLGAEPEAIAAAELAREKARFEEAAASVALAEASAR